MAQIPAENIIDGDIVDIAPLLADPAAHPWDFGPGLDAAALEGTRRVAACEYARADDSVVEGDRVVLYTDQMNFIVPKGHPVERIDC